VLMNNKDPDRLKVWCEELEIKGSKARRTEVSPVSTWPTIKKERGSREPNE
jgi:hypothetical protein